MLRVPIVPVDGLLHGHGTCQRSRCGGEYGHDTVTQVLQLGALGFRDGLAKGREVTAPDLLAGLGAERGHQLCGTDQVSEEHRDVLDDRHLRECLRS